MRKPERLCALIVLLAIAPTAAAQEAHTEPPPGDPEIEILGAAAAFDLGNTQPETLWIRPDTLLFSQPDLDSQQITLIDALIELAVLEHLGPWSRVLYADRLGWVHQELRRSGAAGIAPTGSVSALALVPSANELERRLDLARTALGISGTTSSLGPYALITDVTDRRLLDRMQAIADSLEDSYQRRYGLNFTEDGAQTVALFAEESKYRAFESQVNESADLNARGHAGGGLAALFVEEQRLDESTSLLVHELTHLLNRRALGDAVPSWLEEGLANDLSYSSVDRQGGLKLGTLSGRSSLVGTRASRTLIFEGPFASLNQILNDRANRQSTPLERLVQLTREEFLRPQDRERHYIESTFLVRYLLDGERRRYAKGFRLYLSEVAVGDQPDSSRLLELLDRDWKQLELGLGNYLKVQAAYLVP